MHRRIKFIFIALILVCLCTLALAAGLSSYANSSNAKALLLREINARIQGEITYTLHHISPLYGRVQFRNVRVRAANGEELAGAESLTIDLSIASILKRALVVETVEVNQPWARLVLDKTGQFNIIDAFTSSAAAPTAPTPSTTPAAFNIICNHLRLSDGYFFFSDYSGDRRMFLESVDADVSGNLGEKSGVVKLNIGKAQTTVNGFLSDFKRMHLAMALKNGHIEPLLISGENQFASVLLYGDIRRVFSKPVLDLNLKVDTSVEGVLSFFNLGRDDTGRVKLAASVKGDPGNPRLNLVADYGYGNLAGHAVERMNFQLDLTDRVATLESFSVEADSGRLEARGKADLNRVFPAGFLEPPGDWQDVNYQGRLRLSDLNLATFVPAGDEAGGRADVFLDIEGRGTRLEVMDATAKVGLSIDQFRFGEMARAADIHSQSILRVHDARLWIDDMEVQAAGTIASVEGNLDWKTDQVDARFTIESDEIGSLLSLFGRKDIGGGVALKGSLQGKMTTPYLNVSGVADDLRIKGIELGEIRLEAGLDETGRLNVDSIVVENRWGAMKAAGRVRLFETPYRLHREMPVEARIVLSDLECSQLYPGCGIKGAVGGNLFVSGSVKNPEARADLYAEAIEYKDYHLGDIESMVNLTEGSLFFEKIKISNGQSTVVARGALGLFKAGGWQLAENPEIQLTLTEGRLYLQDITEGMTGELLLDADVGGRLKAPSGNLHLRGGDIDLGVQRISSLDVKVHAADQQVVIEPFEINLPGGGLFEGSGRIGQDQSYRFQLSTRELSVHSIDRLRELEAVSGKLNLNVSGEGRWGHPDIKGSAEWSGLSIRGESIDDVLMQFRVKDSLVSLKGRQTFELDAGYDLSSKAFSMDLVMQNTQLAPWFAMVGRREFGGAVSGTIRAEGSSGNVEHARAEVGIEKLALTFRGDPFAVAENINGKVEHGVFDIPAFEVDLLRQGSISLRGNGDIAGDIDLAVKGDIPLKAVNLLIRDLPIIDGTMSISTLVGGSFQHPEFTGDIRIQEAGMEIPDLQQAVRSVQGTVTFANNRDIVGNISGMLDDGRFDISAVVEMGGFFPKRIDAKATARALPLQLPDTMGLLLNADLAMTGVPEDLLIAGEVTMLEGTYYKDFHFNFLESVQEKERAATPRTVKRIHPLLQPLRFDIHFKHRQPLVVDNNIADLEISPDLLLTGTAETPVLTGAATVNDGIVTYQNKVFEVQQGAVNFINPYQTEAKIDIEGQVEIREWVITISIYGPPDRLIVELSSSPPEEDADIISLLVFKKTTYELNEGSAGASQSPTVLLAQLLATSFGRDIKDSTGIDLLEVEAESAEDKDSTDRIKVTVGKDLTERMTVKYSVESKDGGYVQRASTEYKLLENVVVSGFQDTKGTYGGEFIFRVEFRLFR